ncbi:MAG: S8 family serine peptidase [Candidatus Altiarchaeota archaeon]|nr:S8 family serine peptidase [Candidatus Altiarchaeota archaeon]
MSISGRAGLVALLLMVLISSIPAEECITDGVNDNCLVVLEYKDGSLEIDPDNLESIYKALNIVSPDSHSLDEFLGKEGDELTKLLYDQPRGPWKYKGFFLDPRGADLDLYTGKLSRLVSEENLQKFEESPYGYIVKLRERPLSSYEKISIAELNSKREEILNSHQIALNYAKNNFPDAQVRHQFTGVFNGISLEISADEAKQLKGLGVVEEIYPIKKVQISLTESVSMINADDAWGLLDDEGRNVTGKNITIAIVDTGVDYTHTDFGNCSPTQSSGDIVDYSLESEHPYENDMNETWTITMPGFTSIAVHFTNISTESYYDSVIVSDASGNAVREYSGTYRDIWSTSVDGDTIKITLESDYSVTDWGFAIDEVLNGTVSFSWENCSKVWGGYDFVNDDVDPMDDAGHGTHCAGIALSNGSLKGVAPDARLLAYKVLDSLGSGLDDDIIAGIERAVNDSADVISLSLGSSGNPDDALSQAVDNAANAGAVVVVAAGNSGPDSGTIGSPACARKAITVGATYKEGYNAATSELYLLNDTAAEEIDSEPLEESALTPEGGITAELLFASLGYAENFTGQNFTGKIALIGRGELYFHEKVHNAYDAGAVGAIIYNNQLGNFIGSLINQSEIPAVSISWSNGMSLYIILMENGTVTVNMSVIPSEQLITDFSSRGPAYIYNKPDLVAPGALICASQWDDVYSDSSCYDSEHAAISGTSMATPHVAGAAALILQKHTDWSPDHVKYALLTTAEDYGYDADVQGAGLIDVYRAVNLTNKPPIAIISNITGLEYRT